MVWNEWKKKTKRTTTMQLWQQSLYSSWDIWIRHKKCNKSRSLVICVCNGSGTWYINTLVTESFYIYIFLSMAIVSHALCYFHSMPWRYHIYCLLCLSLRFIAWNGLFFVCVQKTKNLRRSVCWWKSSFQTIKFHGTQMKIYYFIIFLHLHFHTNCSLYILHIKSRLKNSHK